jgi:hypothetical protein
VELRKIAVDFPSLSDATVTKLKKAAILIGTRRVQQQGSKKAMGLIDGGEEGWDQEYNLLAPDEVADRGRYDHLSAVQRGRFLRPTRGYSGK